MNTKVKNLVKVKLSILTDVIKEPVEGELISKNEIYVHVQTRDCRMMIPWKHIELISVIE